MTQLICLAGFFILFARSGVQSEGALNPGKIPFYLDPLVLVSRLLADGSAEILFVLALIPVLLTLIIGRFFCGWICPMGAINQFLSHFSIRLGRKRENVATGLLKTKYMVLILILISAAFAGNMGMVLDPFSLLGRTSAVLMIPGSKNLLTEALPGAIRLQAEVVGVFFLLILALNFFKRRFYCNYVCPLGAFYGLLARFSLLSFRSEQECNGCDACARHCTYGGSLAGEYSKQDCTVCFNCVTECDRNSVGFSSPRLVPQQRIDLGRRGLFGSIGAGALMLMVPMVSYSKKASRRLFARPPGSVNENDFLDRCIRCGLCVQTCPTNFIQHAGLETGVEGLWTPVVNASAGYCEDECRRCTDGCPTGAIESLSLTEKRYFKIGTAEVDRSRCRPFAEGVNCTICTDACVPRAISYREIDTVNYRGDPVRVNGIFVDSTLCNGCGICEFKCPRTDVPGIVLRSVAEQRESPF
ncbi:MAG: 4Fe-4S binding protein [bacterium]|nr:4Fe-4S binding protein [bacterium]